MSHNDDTRSHAAAGTAGSRTLKRSLSHGQMTMIVMGSALGTGLFLGSGTAIAMAGPAVILTYAIGSALASVIGAATGEMAVRYPVRGGFGTIATRYLGPFAGFLTRIAYWTATVLIAGVELVSVAMYLNYWWPQLPLWAGIAAFGVALIVLNLTSVKSFGMLEFFLSSIKVISIVAWFSSVCPVTLRWVPRTSSTTAVSCLTAPSRCGCRWLL